MKVKDAMHSGVTWVAPNTPVPELARMMRDEDIGSIPIGENDRLVGMVTDRDIAVRAVAEGRGPDTPVRDAMTDHVDYCFDDDEVEDVAMKMSDAQVRRFPVLSREDQRLVGIVSLGDLSRSDQAESAGVALGGISDPGGPHNQSTESR